MRAAVCNRRGIAAICTFVSPVWLLALGLGTSTSLIAETVTPSPYWRNTISFPNDAFRAQGSGPEDLGWIKFLIFTSDPTQVYFQDSNHFPFHYDFAVASVVEYAGLDRGAFDALSLQADGQQAILGAVIMPHSTGIKEYGIQFVRQEAYEPAQVVSLFNLVKSKVTAASATKVYYFPSYEQYASTQENRAYLEANGVLVSSESRWATGDVIYSPGWTLGTLKFFTATAIDAAYRNGQLAPGDILLTDGVPAEVPLVAGILSLVPSTPSSHVAILANTYAIPFAYLAIGDHATQAQQLVGKTVLLRTYVKDGVSNVQLTDVSTLLNAQERAEILALKTPPPLEVAPVTAYGAFSASTDGLNPADIRYFGGKAANFGMVRRSVPDHSPKAAAFSFDLWTAFMGQTMSDERTLAETIQARLGGYTYPPTNMAALAADLAAVRDMIKDDTVFAPELQAAVLATLQDPQYAFDDLRNIRFRSSTNVEDSEQFTGAGLYDSFSGCLADDLDGDTHGPSICDPAEANERGVFRAIRKVYASFYNDNAFLARRQFQVDESRVGMGLLVHHSTPDELELANGVATLERKSPTEVSISLVTQNGAVAVTNPPLGALPEEVWVQIAGAGEPSLNIASYSNLLPLGQTVLAWETDYRELVGLLMAVASTFEATTGKHTYVLDFEYKKVAPGGQLRIKQLRELPRRESMSGTAPFMVGDPVQYCLYATEGNNIFAYHRMKALITLTPRNAWLTPAELNAGLYADITGQYYAGGQVVTLSGNPSTWPGYGHTYALGSTTDAWRPQNVGNPQKHSLITLGIPAEVQAGLSPLLTIDDLNNGSLEMRADYLKAERIRSGSSDATTRVDDVTFRPSALVMAGKISKHTIMNVGTVRIDSTYYWLPPTSPFIPTSPFSRFVQTTITGYTTQAIVLTGYFSQTYLPYHHNFGEEFLFEPWVEPGISPSTLAELGTRNLGMIHVRRDLNGVSTITLYPRYAPVDFDRDGYVNHADLEHFAQCFSGPQVVQSDPTCTSADLDGDLDVDQADFGRFQRCYAGTAPAHVTCLEN